MYPLKTNCENIYLSVSLSFKNLMGPRKSRCDVSNCITQGQVCPQPPQLPTYFLQITNYLLTYPLYLTIVQPIQINYLIFLFTYIMNDLKQVSEIKNLTIFVNFENFSPLIRIWIIIGEMKSSILNTCNLYTCLKGQDRKVKQVKLSQVDKVELSPTYFFFLTTYPPIYTKILFLVTIQLKKIKVKI